jgi:DNA processing protein
MEHAVITALASLPEMNVMTIPRLLDIAGGAEELWNILSRGGKRAEALVGADKASMWRKHCRLVKPETDFKRLGRLGIRVLLPGDEGYPHRLLAIYDPPALLFTRGSCPTAEAPYVAVVGSRRASDYGKWASEVLGSELARRGVVVVSGAAYGVDGRAHLGCLRARGRTIAVMGCGVDRAYPSLHADLLERIAASGCVMSEFPPGSPPLPWHFPQRNRIIAGLSHAVVVVEASEKSGALITADMALEEGREVMAVPGPITSPLSLGTNSLIQKGAKLVTDVQDIIDELPFSEQAYIDAVPPQVEGKGECCACDLSDGERAVVELLQDRPRSLDWLAVSLEGTVGELLTRLTSLSFKGWVLEEAGGRYRLLKALNR